ncbi:CoA-transferase family III [Lojkania enalia]|uniref:CoA-transferase family III n=1 Tax=Lojkania enalia TaxID=147567 RepID=A0A9P4JZM1_9PLEO|nr:CoA-transferase family III [Didymosphaeria enalia]
MAYSTPCEARRIFLEGIAGNALLPSFPRYFASCANLVRFHGSASPSIPVNWRWPESLSALKALEATMVNCLLMEKYKVEPTEVSIDTDHASLFVFSPHLATIVGDGEAKVSPESCLPVRENEEKMCKESLYRMMATNIYKTRDGRFYHVHGSLNPDTVLSALGLPHQMDIQPTPSDVAAVFEGKTLEMDSVALDSLMNQVHRQAGTIVYTSAEYFASEHGAANSHVGLYEIVHHPVVSQAPCWWPDASGFPSSPARPLAGLKVVDLTRVIAGPTITSSLAELGASVMRVTSPHVPDFTRVFRDLNWGKWNCHLHLKDEGDKEKLRDLIRDADVVVDGYRPGVMDRLGFGRADIFDLIRDRARGIIHARENCYGWHGPWAHRSGWQGISDACCGVSLAYGEAMEPGEAVTPPFPNSDRCTGVIGSASILCALIRRGEEGGCWGVDLALNYYSQWLVRSVGTYDEQVWADLWGRHGSPVFHHYDNTRITVPRLMQLLRQYDEDLLFKPEFFDTYTSKAMGVDIRKVKPVAKFGGGLVKLGYNIGTRGNGRDAPFWPKNLLDEVVE